MKTTSVKITIIAFLLIISLGFCGSIILPDKTFSETENRPLETLTTPTISGVLSGNYTQTLNSWASDQMPWRNALISLKSSVQIALGVKDIAGTYICKDGTYIEKVTADEALLNGNLNAIDTFFKAQNFSESYFLPVPSASEVLSSTLPALATPLNQTEFIKKAESLASFTTVNLMPRFEKEKLENDLYYNSDHHWTSFAAFTAYNEFLKVANKKDSNTYEKTTVATNFLGTLHSKVLYPFSKTSNVDYYKTDCDSNYKLVTDNKTFDIYFYENLKAYDKYTFFLGGNYPYATCTGGKKGGGTLLLVKDSYANCFVPFLLGSYEKVVIVDPRYYVGSLDDIIKTENITSAMVLYSIDTLAKDNSVQLINN